MRPLVSLRWIVAVVTSALAVMAASAALSRPPTRPPAAPPAPARPADAAARTRAAGSARLAATVRTADGGAIEVTGITSLVDARSEVVARSADHTDEVAVRTLPEGTWVRVGPDGPWTPVDPAAARLAGASATGGWGDLLTRDPHPELDGAGRIRRFRVEAPDGGSLDVRLSDFGAPVDLAPPP